MRKIVVYFVGGHFDGRKGRLYRFVPAGDDHEKVALVIIDGETVVRNTYYKYVRFVSNFAQTFTLNKKVRYCKKKGGQWFLLDGGNAVDTPVKELEFDRSCCGVCGQSDGDFVRRDTPAGEIRWCRECNAKVSCNELKLLDKEFLK
jgi:hypothetical protein